MHDHHATPLHTLMGKLISYEGKLIKEYNFKIREEKHQATLIISVKDKAKHRIHKEK